MAEENTNNKIAYESLTIEQTAQALETNIETGLTSEEAKVRYEKYGPNKLEEKKKKGWFRIFIEQMANPMIYVLFAAIVVTIGISIYETIHLSQIVSAGGAELAKELASLGYKSASEINWFLDAGDWPDVVIILAVILVNAIIGTVQEIKAQVSLEALKNLSSPESTVIRDGKRFKIKSSELVIGDVVVLEEGDTIGADLRLIEAVNLKANESSLTGESVPVSKKADLVLSEKVALGDRANMVFMSTPVTYGRGVGIVTNTAMDTEIGKIATALDNEEDDLTPLQKVLAKLSKVLGYITLGIVVVVLLVDIIWIVTDAAKINVVSNWIDAFLSSIALAVAAIPEGLPAVVTIVLAIGVQRMVKANTVVRKLPSVETLGAVSVVCSDKTGTLTQNKMTVVEAWCDNIYYKQNEFVESNENKHLRLLAKGMSLCSNATVDEGLYGDPTEIALVVFANAFNMHKKQLELEQKRVDELPFDSERKMMSTKHTLEDGTSIVYTKGALDSILKHTTKILENGKVRDITKEDIDKIYEVNKDFSLRALRVLALAYTNLDAIDENNLIFVGLVAMIDPAREEAKPAVSMFKSAGITTIMITGDHKDTAFAIAKDLGICESLDQCVMGSEVDEMTEQELQERCLTARVFARVSPQNKVQIVKAFKANGNICAMTGDGVNDAPSLKAADIGIAMGITGTDVAKGAADMVLTDDNFASIEKAVEEGRGIYANIKKTVLFLLSSNVAEVMTMFIIICLGFPAPLIAIHLLWVNLVTDSLPAVALGMDPKDPDNMKDKPRSQDESIFAKGGWPIVIGYGAAITILVLIAFFFDPWMHGQFGYNEIKVYFENEAALRESQTMAFIALSFSQLFHMLGMSNPRKSFINVFKNKNWMMAVAFFVGIGLQLMVVLVPGINEIFSTTALNSTESVLNWQDWLITLSLAALPLVVHEITILVMHIRKKLNKNK